MKNRGVDACRTLSVEHRDSTFLLGLLLLFHHFHQMMFFISCISCCYVEAIRKFSRHQLAVVAIPNAYYKEINNNDDNNNNNNNDNSDSNNIDGVKGRLKKRAVIIEH